MMSIDTPLIDIYTAPIDLDDQTDEVRAGIIDAVTRGFEELCRDRLTGHAFRVSLEITARDVLARALDVVSRYRNQAADGGHADYLHTIALALKGALED